MKKKSLSLYVLLILYTHSSYTMEKDKQDNKESHEKQLLVSQEDNHTASKADNTHFTQSRPKPTGLIEPIWRKVFSGDGWVYRLYENEIMRWDNGKEYSWFTGKILAEQTEPPTPIRWEYDMHRKRINISNNQEEVPWVCIIRDDWHLVQKWVPLSQLPSPVK